MTYRSGGRFRRSAFTGRSRWSGAVVAAVLAAVVVVVGPSLVRDWAVGHESPAAPPTFGGPGPAEARQLLADIPVKGRAPMTGYRRDLYGRGWPSVGGCDMRNRILSRDLVDVVYRSGTRDCVVESGTLNDPYTGRTIHFVRGNDTSSLVQVDHRYPLALSWQQGAQQWSQARREKFAADPLNLVAVEGKVNQAKGASGPGSWLPPHSAARCQYVADFVVVAARYQLSMNPGDHRAASEVLRRC